MRWTWLAFLMLLGCNRAPLGDDPPETSDTGGESGVHPDVPPDSPACASFPTDFRIAVTGDFDGDGREDVLLRAYAGRGEESRTKIAYADGGCQFTVVDGPRISFIPHMNLGNSPGYAVFDMNGDGVDDLLGMGSAEEAAQSGSGPFLSAIFSHDRSFGPVVTSPIEGLRVEAFSIVYLDFDQDGRRDVLLGESHFGDTALLVLDVEPTGKVSVQRRVWAPYCFVVGMATGDWDGDGVEDLAVGGAWPSCNGSAPETPMYLWSGASLPEISELVIYGGEGYPSLWGYDVDGDGWKDLLAEFDTNGGRYLYPGSPNGLQDRVLLEDSDFGACYLRFIGRYDLDGQGKTVLVGYVYGFPDSECYEERGYVAVDIDARTVGAVWQRELGGVFIDVDGDGAVERVWLESLDDEQLLRVEEPEL